MAFCTHPEPSLYSAGAYQQHHEKMNDRRVILANVKKAAGKAATGIREATHHAGSALDWGRKQHARIKPHLPKTDEIEAGFVQMPKRTGGAKTRSLTRSNISKRF